MASSVLNPTDEAAYLRRQIGEAQHKLDQLTINNLRERNLAQQRSEFASAQRAVVETRQRYTALQELASTHLAELRCGVENAHEYREREDFGRTVREHVVPGNPQLDSEKRGSLDVLAQRLTQTLIAEYQFAVRLEHAEARLANLKTIAASAVVAGASQSPEPAIKK